MRMNIGYSIERKERFEIFLKFYENSRKGKSFTNIVFITFSIGIVCLTLINCQRVNHLGV